MVQESDDVVMNSASNLKRKMIDLRPSAPTTFNEDEDDSQYVKKRTTSQPVFIYENLTLDQIIRLKSRHREEEELQNSIVEEEEGGVIYGVDDTVGGPKMSPLFVLKQLNEDGELFEMEAEEISNYKVTDFRAHRWRVIWTHKDIKGLAEAPRKMMALQIAAFDLISKLRSKYPNLPPVIVPQGSLVNPFLFKLLDEKCEKDGLDVPEYVTQVQVGAYGRKEYTTFTYVANFVFVGKSFNGEYSRRFSAKRAYEHLTRKIYPDDKIIVGNELYMTQKYNQIESEAQQFIKHYEKGTKRAKMESFSHTPSTMPSRPGSSLSISAINLEPSPLPIQFNFQNSEINGKNSINPTVEAAAMLNKSLQNSNLNTEEIDEFDFMEVDDPLLYDEGEDDEDEDKFYNAFYASK